MRGDFNMPPGVSASDIPGNGPEMARVPGCVALYCCGRKDVGPCYIEGPLSDADDQHDTECEHGKGPGCDECSLTAQPLVDPNPSTVFYGEATDEAYQKLKDAMAQMMELKRKQDAQMEKMVGYMVAKVLDRLGRTRGDSPEAQFYVSQRDLSKALEAELRTAIGLPPV